MTDQKHLAFARTYIPKKPKDSYGWVLTHGREKIELCLRLTDALDDKGDALMRYIGGTAVAVTAVLSLLSKEPVLRFLIFSPTLAALLMAAIYAMRCTKPTGLPALPAIETAFRYADYFEDDAATRFYATLVPLEDRLRTLLNKKTSAIHFAIRYFLAALFWLPFAVCLAEMV